MPLLTGLRARHLLSLAGVAAICAALLWQRRAVGDFHIDDAYITFSFSKNLATGHGPVYSHGLRVEGYSNFLWMLLVAGPLALRPSLDPYFIARILTLPFVALLGWATYALIRRDPRGHGPPRILGWVGLLFLAFDADLVIAGLCGLETLPFVALLVTGFALYVRGREGDALARRLTIPCFVAVALMRIDGFLPLGFIIAAELASSLLERRFRAREFLRWAGPGVAVYLLWFAWRWRYYGLLWPTTVYAKELIPEALPNRGATYARDFWTSTGLALVIPFALLALAGRARRHAVLLTIFVAAHTAYVIRVGGDWMPFWRFFLPIIPLSVVLLAWGIDEAIGRAARRRPGAGAAVTAVSFAALVWMAQRMDGHAAETKAEKDKMAAAAQVARGMVQNLVPAARLIAHVVKPGQRLVSDYAGVMAYFTDAEVIDMWGLANEDIALHGTTEGVNPIWGRTCPRCYAKMDPDFFHVPSIKAPAAYGDERAVVAAVWQSGAIGRYVDFKKFAAGRVVDTRTRQAFYFLERRREGSVFQTRKPARDIVIEYPFERAGGAAQ